MGTPLTVELHVEQPGADFDQLTDLTALLVADLCRLPALSLDGNCGSKSGLNPAFLVKLLDASAIAGFVSAMAAWLARDRSRTLKLQIGEKVLEANNLSSAEQQELIRWFQVQAGLQLTK